MPLRFRLQRSVNLKLLFQWCQQIQGTSVSEPAACRVATKAPYASHGHRRHDTALLALLTGATLLLPSSQPGCCEADTATNPQNSDLHESSSTVRNEHTAKFSIFCDKARRCAAEVSPVSPYIPVCDLFLHLQAHGNCLVMSTAAQSCTSTTHTRNN
jgi:hypothetical protein